MKTTVSSTDDQKKAPNDGNKPERIWPQILAIFTACMVPLTAGMLFTWSSPFIPKISSDKTNYDISEEEASYFTVIPPIAMIITSLLFSNLNDIFGRKPTMIINAIPYVIAWILAAVASNIWVFYASRVFSGIGDGFVFSSVPMYIAEISTPKVRGVWGNALTFFIYIGQLLIAIIGSYCSVKVSSYIGMCVPVLFIVIFLFMPESPYFYVMKGKFEEARSSLRWLRGIEDVEEDFLQIKADVERQMSEKGTWKDLFVIDSNRRALYAGFDIGIDVTALKWIPLTGMIIYVVFYSVGIGIVPTLMLGEAVFCKHKAKRPNRSLYRLWSSD
ncbi:hypothetical protein NQ317_013997 [Molorchus minor]|uniref:Major facilitator superfamily (MFS) profile domain-containing protein n=1 Tax=Molorchus minor TaxID=1323400 RepID=A0ABQ9J2R9_9CUCU|nr:hypothetical protein NQ317_013997 [Molorchus minor]